MIEHALAYAARGISVFPLLPRSKAPMVPNGFLKAVTSADQVRTWWRRRPDCNIGIATGAPAGFWVLDVDGEEAEVALAALEAQFGALPATVQQKTGRGRHLCFAWDPGGPEMRNRSKVGGAPIDVRGNGGYIVAPPSVHPGDPKKGVPPGRIYAWDAGRSPDEIGFAAAPVWLVDLCKPKDQAVAEAAPIAPRAPIGGRATRYGEVVLDACIGSILSATKGSRDSTLYRFACKLAGLCATGHIEQAYLRDELVRAGRAHVPDAMTEAQLQRQVDRAMAWGLANPWGPEPGQRRPAIARASARNTVVQDALVRADGVEALEGGTSVPGPLLASWLARRRLRPDGVPGAGERLRLVGENFVLPLQEDPRGAQDGAAAFALDAGGRCTGLRGLSAGRVAVLAWPDDVDQLLVATDLADAWALGEAAFESGDPMAVVIAPRLSTFAGAPLGDRWARVMGDVPALDPDHPAWTRRGLKTVYLAVRRDLQGPQLRTRKAQGGTRRLDLSGEAAGRFWGGLAVASWRAAGANAVRVLSPPTGRAGFSDSDGVA